MSETPPLKSFFEYTIDRYTCQWVLVGACMWFSIFLEKALVSQLNRRAGPPVCALGPGASSAAGGPPLCGPGPPMGPGPPVAIQGPTAVNKSTGDTEKR